MHAGAAEGVTIRPARADDEDALLAVDRATWSPHTSPSHAPPQGPFFGGTTEPHDVLVAEIDGRLIGYGKIRHPTPLPASEHVWEVFGLGVDPQFEGRGAGRALMEALIDEARARGGQKMTLRVFAPNDRARRLYKSLGFEREGLLKREFRIGDGEYVDDILMAKTIR
jgi:ribosomal protein S18 acetylase RimI-like enzyme